MLYSLNSCNIGWIMDETYRKIVLSAMKTSLALTLPKIIFVTTKKKAPTLQEFIKNGENSLKYSYPSLG